MDFEVFAREQHGRLVAALTLYCGDRWLAEELTQDALVRARERWERVGGMAAPGAWVHRVAINLANSRFRRRRAERRAQRRLAADARPGVEGVSADGLAVREALAVLPDSQRQALVLRYFTGLSVAETAEVMEMTAGSVRSACHRGLTGLRERFEVTAESDREAHDVP